MLTQDSIKISQFSYFSFSFKLNEKKKMLFKIWLGEGSYKKIFVGGGLGFNRGF